MINLQAGVAKKCITPPAEMMPAYFHGNHIFEGVYQDIFMRTLVFDNGERRMAYLTYELGDMARIDELKAALQKKCGLEPENLCFSATHGHESPTMANTHKGVRNIPEKLKWVLEYGDFIIGQTVECVKEAIASMKPARYGVGTGKSYINVNRDQLYENGLWSQGMDFEGVSDKELAVLSFETEDGKLIGALINYAVHGTVCYRAMDEKNEKFLIGSDIPGMTSAFLEERYKEDGSIFLWTSGAAGNQNPIFFGQNTRYYHDRTHDASYEIGDKAWILCASLAETHAMDVIGILNSDKALREDMHISVTERSLTLPGQKFIFPDDGLHIMARAEHPFNGVIEEGKPVELELKLVTMDDYAFFGINGELDCGTGLRMKAVSPLKSTFIITHTGERAGYLPDKEGYDKRTIEFYASEVKDGCTEERLMPLFLDMFQERLRN